MRLETPANPRRVEGNSVYIYILSGLRSGRCTCAEDLPAGRLQTSAQLTERQGFAAFRELFAPRVLKWGGSAFPLEPPPGSCLGWDTAPCSSYPHCPWTPPPHHLGCGVRRLRPWPSLGLLSWRRSEWAAGHPGLGQVAKSSSWLWLRPGPPPSPLAWEEQRRSLGWRKLLGPLASLGRPFDGPAQLLLEPRKGEGACGHAGRRVPRSLSLVPQGCGLALGAPHVGTALALLLEPVPARGPGRNKPPP